MWEASKISYTMVKENLQLKDHWNTKDSSRRDISKVKGR